MTINEKMKELLMKNGMFEKQANEILKIAKSKMKEMEKIWNEDVKNYPGSMLKTLWIRIKSFALNWIDENMPKAWFRELFI